ncbi:VanZ family protein [Virgibacillus halodenitrificans]|uniref:VanZ family protein n=2 Tax=Virgibacillus halodenitrificans TaxID=1482 RepID=A0AAC9NK23_VIRHA|nr:VanZ family protein [Virgibacillus halodenitrificans]APC47603.1 VanZ family protein [Virgibacillus halodenitrificans]MEC2158747.1 VanZ family protein [Virgibacillus halodenitrificans]MYL44305.1 VanZ family protein [Virgibacillus halodenitrificans]CDQ32434.1 VanZ like family protein [Virgibacillus halodenitrificans]
MEKFIKVILKISFMFYLVALVILLFIGNRGYLYTDLTLLEYMKTSSNFVPFKTINTYFTAFVDNSMNRNIPIKNLVGNLFMFLPMGIYLPFLIKKIAGLGRFVLSMIVLLFFIEVIQLVTRRGSFDIDDFILNMIGALIGFAIWKTKYIQKLLN